MIGLVLPAVIAFILYDSVTEWLDSCSLDIAEYPGFEIVKKGQLTLSNYGNVDEIVGFKGCEKGMRLQVYFENTGGTETVICEESTPWNKSPLLWINYVIFEHLHGIFELESHVQPVIVFFSNNSTSLVCIANPVYKIRT